MATISQLLKYGREQLNQCGNEYAKYESKVLLEETLGCNFMYILAHGDETVLEEQEQRYVSFIERRCQHYPLQYMLGFAHFMDYTFFVNEHVLIPRNDTEVLVECANELIDTNYSNVEAVKLLDLCCGSGCIGISLKCYHNEIDLTLSDLSEDALSVTKKNLEQHAVDANVVCGDLYENVSGKYHVIASNPPYIERDVIDTLQEEVKDYEPMMALDGGEDGLDFYRRIIAEAPQYLEKAGYLIVEIGYNQGKAVSELMETAGFCEVVVKDDYAGLNRVVYGHL